MLVELCIHGHHVDGSCKDGSQHLIWHDLPPVLRVLQVMCSDVLPDPLHNLENRQHHINIAAACVECMMSRLLHVRKQAFWQPVVNV